MSVNRRRRGHPGTDDPNYGADSRLSFGEQGREERAQDGQEVTPLFGKGVTLALLVWGVVVISVTGGIAGVTMFWPLLPIIGAAVPLAFAFLAVWHAKNQQEALQGREIYAALASDDRDEREVLGALLRNGRLTPVIAAAHTSLSVARSGEVLERLAGKGHLEVQALEGSLVYSLQVFEDADARRSSLTDRPVPDPDDEVTTVLRHVEPPEEPLSDREFEVLKLLASGRTNREVAGELYVAPGTVKAHVANIYRKLEARNRAEALERARCLNLLD